MLTVADLKQTLPAHLRTAATQSLADRVNQITTDPDMAKQIRENFVSYTHVLKEGRFKTEDYLNAVAYVSYKIMGYTNREAYMRTFPQRYLAQAARGANDREISAYVAAYHKNKLVNLILEQTLVPVWVLNQDLYDRAINTQAELMMNASSEKVRTYAANSLLTHLKRPENRVAEPETGIKDNSGMAELNIMLAQMAQRQQELIAQGATTREIAHQPFPIDQTTPH